MRYLQNLERGYEGEDRKAMQKEGGGSGTGIVGEAGGSDGGRWE